MHPTSTLLVAPGTKNSKHCGTTTGVGQSQLEASIQCWFSLAVGFVFYEGLFVYSFQGSKVWYLVYHLYIATPKEFLTGLPNACSTPLFWDQKEGPSFARSARRSFQQLLAVTWSSGSTHYCSKSTQPTWQDSILAWTFLAMRVLAWTFFRGK